MYCFPKIGVHQITPHITKCRLQFEQIAEKFKYIVPKTINNSNKQKLG